MVKRAFPVVRVERVPTLLLVLAAGVVFFSVFDRFTISSIPTLRTVSAIFGVPLALAWAVLRGLRLRVQRGPKVWVLALLVTIILGDAVRVSTRVAPFAVANFLQWFQILVLAFILIDVCRDPRALRYLGGAAAGGVLIVGLFGLAPVERAQGRAGVDFINLNMQAYFYGLVCVAALALILDKWPRRNTSVIVALAVFAVFFALLVRTGSRGGLGSTMLGLGIVLALMLKRRNVSAYLTLLPLVVAAAGYFLLSSYVVERIDRSIAGEDYGARDVIWAAAISMVRESPFLGSGPRFVEKLGELTRGRDTSTHNQYLQVLVAHGVTGLLVFLALLASAARRCWAYRGHVVGSAAFAMVITSVAMGITNDITFQRYFWLLMGIAANIDIAVTAGRSHGLTRLKWVAVAIPPPAVAPVTGNAG